MTRQVKKIVKSFHQNFFLQTCFVVHRMSSAQTIFFFRFSFFFFYLDTSQVLKQAATCQVTVMGGGLENVLYKETTIEFSYMTIDLYFQLKRLLPSSGEEPHRDSLREQRVLGS